MPKSQNKDRKGHKNKDRKNLIGRVKKAVKKSRKRLDQERFEKELKRTITFLEKIRTKITKPSGGRKSTAAAASARAGHRSRTGKG